MVGSTIAREVDGGIYLHAGPEVGVAQGVHRGARVALVALRIARLRNLSILQWTIPGLRLLPDQVVKILEKADELQQLADRFLGLPPTRSTWGGG